jgi:transaldolase/glucose-6-phosphate isomerase
MKEQFRVDGIRFELGENEDSVQKWIHKATADKIIERIWKRDHTVWKPEPTEIGNRLGWLDVATRNKALIGDLPAFVTGVKEAGITKVLLLGMGGSSLAPELFAKTFRADDGIALEVLDSTDPQAVRAKAESHLSRETLFLVSSKSGGTVETFSMFMFFYNRAIGELGVQEAGSHFAAITDPGSELAKTADKLHFRQTFLADTNIGGRYSALSHFGLVPAALLGIDLAELLSSAETMAGRCQNASVVDNPGASLGIALGCLAAAGRDKATFLLPADRVSFGDWAEQLIAESTGKDGKGILPVVSEAHLKANAYTQDRVFIALGDQISVPTDSALITLDWDSSSELGGQFFLWEFATAVVGWVLGINPFDQPNVEAAKVRARLFIDEYRQTGQLPQSKNEPLSAAPLHQFLQKAKPGDYIAIQAYVQSGDLMTATLQRLRSFLGEKYGVATTLGFGPRFLHSTGQLHKGDRGNGLFVQLVTPPPANDLAIPNEAGSIESDLSFGVLKQAQALGDAEALRESGRRVIAFQLGADAAEVNALLEQG